MVAVVIDPIVCHSSIWWMFPECYGLLVMSALPLSLMVATGIAAGLRQMAARRLAR